jgi:hypothetical protein
LQGLAAALTVAAFLAAPAVAPATPQFRINGTLAGAAKQNVVQYGTLTLENAFVGEWKCSVLAGLPVWNEGGNGFASVEGLRTYNCSSASCPGAAVVTAENPVELVEKENSKKEIEYSAKRGFSTLPWPAEAVAPQAGVSRLKISKMKLYLDCPAEAPELEYTGSLEPLIANGAKNGMNPSHLAFEGKGGKTGSLICTPVGPPPCGSLGEGGELFVSGELTTLGAKEELITAE